MRPGPVLDLVGKRGWFFLFSFVLLVPGVISLAIPPRLTLGIDFKGGSEFSVRFQQPVNADDLRDELDMLDHPEARVQGAGQNEFFVRSEELRGAGAAPPIGPAPETERDEIEAALAQRFGPLVDDEGTVTNEFIQFASVSESISRDIGRSALFAVALASAAIFVYLWWSFRAVPQSFRFGSAAVIALIHDVLFVLGAFSILGKVIDAEINKEFIAAILTVIGFSVHDSIVVFDRIRETVSRGEERTFTAAVNSSLLQTMGRSLNTSLTLVFAILALLLMGGESIREFLWAMLIGTVAGVYSSVFIASQILVSWDEGDIPRLFRRILGRERPEEYEPAPIEA
ncbi:MAG: protein translocase subunit SecF [Dehalococcoidia bacterium]|nr:protein translocase subunit SecF [Dehalococcoidia bacterium]